MCQTPKLWCTTSFLEVGRCRKAMLGVCVCDTQAQVYGILPPRREAPESDAQCVCETKQWFTASFLLQGGRRRRAMLRVCVCVCVSEHWFTASFLQGGRCRKEMLGVCALAYVCEDSQRLPSCVFNPFLPAKEFMLLMQFPRRRVSQRGSANPKRSFSSTLV